MARTIQVTDKRTGEVRSVTLLNPSEKGEKYALELSNGEKLSGAPLSRSQAALRMGYLQARRDNARAYNAKHGRQNRKKGPILNTIQARGRRQQKLARSSSGGRKQTSRKSSK